MTGLAGFAAGGPVGAALAKPAVAGAWRIAKVALPLLAMLAVAIWIYALKADVRRLTKERDNLQSWQANVVTVVTAEVPPDRRAAVTPSEAANEIRWLGREYRTHKQALDEQSAKLRTAAAEAAQAVNAASEARKRAKEASSGLRAIRDSLNAPGRSTGLTEAEWGKL